MSDNFWFFPKQQNVGNSAPVDSTPPSTPAPSAIPPIASSPAAIHQSDEKTLEDALSDIEKEMPAVPVAHPRLELLKHTLEDIKKNVQKAIDLLNEESGSMESSLPAHDVRQLSRLVPGMEVDTTRHLFHPGTPPASTSTSADEGTIIEGMFDGQGMVGPDGKEYAIPPNYASKSKLVEGDILKLTINNNGSFIYKQIGPIARRRVIGILETDEETHTFIVKGEGQTWRVLTASVTYFKGVPGDEVVILIPRDKSAKWAAVENIIKKF